MQPEQIQSLIEQNLPQARAQVTGDGAHFQAVVISDTFLNCSPLARQRAVYNSVQPHIQNGNIHALTIKTYTQQEFQSQSQPQLSSEQSI